MTCNNIIYTQQTNKSSNRLKDRANLKSIKKKLRQTHKDSGFIPQEFLYHNEQEDHRHCVWCLTVNHPESAHVLLTLNKLSSGSFMG